MQLIPLFINLVTLVLVVSISAHPSVPSVEEGKRLIKVSEAEPAKWLSQKEIRLLIRDKVHFMDVTNRNYPTKTHNSSALSAFPTSMRSQATVRETFKNVNISRMEEFVQQLTSYFTNRYYNSKLGAEASEFIFTQVEQIIKESRYKGNVTVTSFVHSWPQSSVIARIQGSENGVLIMGAHMDSINSDDADNGPAPGADDNASGTVTIMEAFLILLESGIIPKRSIEFHWYAAEEGGLKGSQDIAERYYNEGVDVIAMLNFDVVGNYEGNNQVSFVTDNTDSNLNAFLRLAVNEYLTFTWANAACDYACSDHASWNKFGFPAAFCVERNFSPNMHTSSDTIDRVYFIQVKEFVKLALCSAIELTC